MSTSGQCVVGWYPDEAVKGTTNLKPVTCGTVIESLRTIIAKVALGFDLEAEEKDIVDALAHDFDQAVRDLVLTLEREKREDPLRLVPLQDDLEPA
jgi:hypothetical protein